MWIPAAWIFLGGAACSDEPQPAAKATGPALSTGLYKLARPPVAPLTPQQQAEIERLEAIGYGTGSRPAAVATGVTVGGRDGRPGLNLYVSAHAPEAILMDMAGRRLHVWRVEAKSIWKERTSWDRAGARYFRRAYSFANGDLLVIFEGVGIARLDARSAVLWAFPAADQPPSVDPHHALAIGSDGTIYALTRRARMAPWLDESKPVLDDFVSILDPNGVELRRISIVQAFERSRFRWLLTDRKRRAGDLLHTNSIQRLDGSLASVDPAFAAGNLLVSMRNTSALAVIDSKTETVVWVGQGEFRRQHDAQVLTNGRLMLFDNGPKSGTASQVLELDPVDLQVAWRYAGDARNPLHSATAGLSQRLPDGNTLVVESNNGRALEIDPSGEIVWEFRSPHRAGPQNRYVATLFDLVRLPPDFPVYWADAGRSPPAAQP